MARRKFRHSQRKPSNDQRTYKEYLSNQPAPLTTRTELIRLIRGGEDTYLELKVKLSNPEKVGQEIVALANTAGGAMIFGVTDQLRVEGIRNPEGVRDEIVEICRKNIYPSLVPFIDIVAFDNGRRIVVLDVVPRSGPYRTAQGQFFVRLGAEKREATQEQLSDLIGDIRPLYYENIPIPGAKDSDFDDGLIWGFAKSFENEAAGQGTYETISFLKKDLLMGVGTGAEILPTVSAMLLFGKNERVQTFLPQSVVEIVRYAGKDESSEIIERESLNGNILFVYEALLGFIDRYCDLLKHKPKRGRSEDSESPIGYRGTYHIYSVREAVGNLLVHRDLALRGIESKVSIFENAIEFVNPRRTNGFVPPASRAIRFGLTQRVNPQIVTVFTRREYGANPPQGGLPMILKQSTRFSGQRVELFTTNDRFRLKIKSA